MRTVDRILGWLMLASGILLCVLCAVSFASHTHDLRWTAGDCLTVLLLSSCNLMRAERPHDRTLARVCIAGNVLWLIQMIVYALTSVAYRLPAALAVLAAALLVFSSRTRRRSRPM